MKIVVRVLLFAALVAVGIWLWTVLFPSPEKLIRKRLAEVARLASFSGGEGLLTQGTRVQSLANCFAPEVELTIDLPRHTEDTMAGRDEITEAALAARRTLRSLNVELLDPNVVLSADKQSAVVDLTARVRVPDERDFIVQEMKFTLKKINGEWLIIRVETVRTLTQATGADGVHPRMFALNLTLNRNDAVGMGSAPASGATDNALVVGIGGREREPISGSAARRFGARARRTAAEAAALPGNSSASFRLNLSLTLPATT